MTKQLKRLASFLAVLALLCSLAVAVGAAEDPADLSLCLLADPANPGLQFKADGTFTIIQVADMQEFAISSKITRDFLYDLAKTERPDLFVLSGDNIHCAEADPLPGVLARMLIKAGIDGFMDVFDKIYDEFGTRVTMVYGNHDNEATKVVTKAQEFAMYAAHRSFVGHYVEAADKGTLDEQGQHYGTHNLLVNGSGSAGATPVFGIWMFDSGSYDLRGGYSCVQKPQIDWFKATNEATGKLPSLAFQHIPVAETVNYLAPADPSDPTAWRREYYDAQGELVTKYVSPILPAGVKGEIYGAPGSGSYSQGQCAALDEAGNVLALFWGHDHNNTYELRRADGTDLVNSPASGFGNYGEARIRGARVITLQESDLTDYDTHIVRYLDFYGDGPLWKARVELFSTINSAANIFDVLFFRPLLWISGLFA